MRTIEVEAKTVDLAIEKGLQMLGLTQDDVEINILQKESMLKKAKIEMTTFENFDERAQYLERKKEEESAPKKIKVEITSHMEKKQENRELNEEEQQVAEKVNEFLTKIFDLIEAKGTIVNKILQNDLYFIITGENMGQVIGFHGDSLDALQSLANAFVKNNIPTYRKKIFLDVENYRAKRQDSLENMAKSMAEKVLNMKRSLKLEPMTSFERRIIHTCLQNIEHISTHSEGEEPNRYLVIDYVK